MTEITNTDPAVVRGWLARHEVFVRLVVAAVLLYAFLLSISLMGLSFKLFGARFAESLIGNCSNPLVGFFIGVFATGIIQSSSTTTSLVVGFVGGGVLPIELAIPVIIGANIGTTITNILVSFGFVARREDFRRAFSGATVHDFFNLCSAAVFLPIELKFHIIQQSAQRLTTMFISAGGITFSSPLKTITQPVAHGVLSVFSERMGLAPWLAGVLLLTLAAVTLVGALFFLVRSLRFLVVNKAERLINKYLFRNDLTALILGLCLTAFAQSSSVTTSLVVPLVGAGVVTLSRCYPYTLGANLGTTCTALLASLATVKAGATGAPGVTAAFAHLVFNVLGILIFYPLRSIPIYLATRLAALASESKRWAILFVLAVFFGFPLLVIFLSR